MEPPSRKRRAAAEVVTRGTAEQQGGAGTEGVTRGTASFSPHVTRPTRKARTHSAADAQRRVRTAVWGAGLRLHGAIAGASLGRNAGLRLHGAIAGASPGPRMDVRLGACGARQLPPRAAVQQGGFRRIRESSRTTADRAVRGATAARAGSAGTQRPPHRHAQVRRLHAGWWLACTLSQPCDTRGGKGPDPRSCPQALGHPSVTKIAGLFHGRPKLPHCQKKRLAAVGRQPERA